MKIYIILFHPTQSQIRIPEVTTMNLAVSFGLSSYISFLKIILKMF